MQGRSDPNRELLDAGALVGHLVPEGTVHRFLAEHRQRLFPDEPFGDLFPSGRGRPSVPADVIATVLVLQSLEGLSDRDAVQAVRTDLRWKVAAGLALDDEGFHPTVLTLWRNKLRASDRPERIFDAVREVIAETGVLKGKVRRALDSTVLDDAVATQETVTGEPPNRQVLADAAYGSGPTRVAPRRRRHRLAIKPWPTIDTGRFARDDFDVDHHARTATCPAGHTVTLTAANNAIFDRHCNRGNSLAEAVGPPHADECSGQAPGKWTRLPTGR